MRSTAMPKPNYVYIKNGDAVDQVERILDPEQNTSTSGPDAFIADFLINGSYSQVQVLSRHRRAANTSIGTVSAEVVRDGQSAPAKVFSRVKHLMLLVRRLFSTHPTRILCGSTGSRLWAAYVYSLLLRVPLVHSRHNRVAGVNDGLIHRLSANIDALILRRVQAVVCHGPYLVDEMVKIGVSANKIFEFDVDFADYESALRNYNRETLSKAKQTNSISSKYLLFVGRVEVEKGIIDLLHAASETLKADSELMLVFAGDGAGRSILEREIERLGLKSKVKLLGRVPHSELVPLFVNATSLVAPTKPGFPEGRCMSVMEALVMGCPAIVPNFGPFPYLIDHNSNGLLHEPGSVSDLSKQLKRLLTEPELAQCLNAGAAKAGEQLKTPPRTFNEALLQAFT